MRLHSTGEEKGVESRLVGEKHVLDSACGRGCSVSSHPLPLQHGHVLLCMPINTPSASATSFSQREVRPVHHHVALNGGYAERVDANGF